MAGLEPFREHIYHEKQEPGSMLCAQHALNSLLQSHIFGPTDLSAIASSLDALEAAYSDQSPERTSTNMDDTGFFSVQVLEDALKVWGLTLVRWQSEAMRPFHSSPHAQLAFILNLEQHWFTLRRFGPAQPSAINDPGIGHWFNLNSFLPAPEWISQLHLGMVLQQAEAEGYSVFAVAEIDPTGELTLSRTEADDIAGTIPQPTSAGTGQRLSTSRIAAAGLPNTAATATSSGSTSGVLGAEDEDLMLQAALQASLMGDTGFAHDELPDWVRDQELSAFSRAAVPAQESLRTGALDRQADLAQQWATTDEALTGVDHDHVAASLARSRALLDRTLREQEHAMREGVTEDLASQFFQRAVPGTQRHRTRFADELEEGADDAVSSEAAARAGPRPRRTRGQDEEEAFLQRALEDSQAELDHGLMDIEQAEPAAPRQPLQPLPMSMPRQAQRNYDDEDEELQAALRASLENVPGNFVVPNEPTASTSKKAVTSSSVTTVPIQSTQAVPDDDEEPAALEPVKEEQPSAEEMRRRRLARFGA